MGAPGGGVTSEAEPPGASCQAGGVRIVSASGTQYLCNAVTDGGGAGVVLAIEPAGANCPDGGARITAAGNTVFVCNGEPGARGMQGTQGTQGTQGPAGESVVAESEDAGLNCPSGGARFTVGRSTTYACNGPNTPAYVDLTDAGRLDFNQPADLVRKADLDGYRMTGVNYGGCGTYVFASCALMPASSAGPPCDQVPVGGLCRVFGASVCPGTTGGICGDGSSWYLKVGP